MSEWFPAAEGYSKSLEYVRQGWTQRVSWRIAVTDKAFALWEEQIKVEEARQEAYTPEEWGN